MSFIFENENLINKLIKEAIDYENKFKKNAQTVDRSVDADYKEYLELAYGRLKEFMQTARSEPVPIHLRNAPTKLMTELGYGREYKYAHDFPHRYVPNEQYFPDDMSPVSFYQPGEQGFEQRIRERLDFLASLDKASQ